MRSYFDAAGRPLPDRAYSWGAASALGQSREFLLARQPDLQVREPTWNNTILETAAYGGDPDIIAVIKPLFEASPLR